MFVELHVDGDVAGTYTLSSRRLHFGERSAIGVYRGLLTVHSDARGRGLGRQLVKRTLGWMREEAERFGEPLITWGCVESSNARSRGLLESLGAERIGSLDSLLVYRQWPRSRIDIEDLSSEDERVAASLAAVGERAGLRGDAGTSGRYFAVVDGSEIVAGARATITRIDLSRAVGAYGAFHERVGRLIPAVRRRFDPKNFTYLRLSDVVAAPESASVWRRFLPALMHEHGVHMAMFVLDPRSSTYRALEGCGLFGGFARKTRTQLDVLATAWNLPDDTMVSFSRSPLGIGPLDA